MSRHTYGMRGEFLSCSVALCCFLQVWQDAILQYFDSSMAKHASHQAMGNLVWSSHHDLGRDQPILQVGIRPFDGRSDLEPLLLGRGQNSLFLAPLVRIDDRDTTISGNEVLDGLRIVGTVHQGIKMDDPF